MRKSQCAFTLIELLVSLALLAILASLALPSFEQLLNGQRLRASSLELRQALGLARHAAIARGVPVLVDNQDGDWNSGWQVFVDSNGNGRADAGETVLHGPAQVAAGVRISANTPLARHVRYVPDGRTEQLGGAFQAGTLSLCHASGQVPSRRLIVSATGRVRLESGAADDC